MWARVERRMYSQREEKRSPLMKMSLNRWRNRALMDSGNRQQFIERSLIILTNVSVCVDWHQQWIMNRQTHRKGKLINITFLFIRTQRIIQSRISSLSHCCYGISACRLLILISFSGSLCVCVILCRSMQLNGTMVLINVFFGTFSSNPNNRHKPLSIGHAW